MAQNLLLALKRLCSRKSQYIATRDKLEVRLLELEQEKEMTEGNLLKIHADIEAAEQEINEMKKQIEEQRGKK